MTTVDIAMLYVVIASGISLGFFFVIVIKRLKLSAAVLRAVGIVLVVLAVCALAFSDQVDGTAAIGVLGAVAGYLFGAAGATSSGSVSTENVGDGNTIVGRDLNQRVDELTAETVNLRDLVAAAVDLNQQRGESGNLVLEIVTPKVGSFDDDRYVRLVEGVISRMARSGNRLISFAGPHDSWTYDLSSSIFVFEARGPSVVSRLSFSALGFRDKRLPYWDDSLLGS